jgi:integrase
MASPRRRTRGSGAVERLPSGRHRARWRTLDGRYASQSFTIRADAERFLRQTLVDQEREGIGIQRRDVTVASVADSWWQTKQRSVKPRTAERYEDHLTTIRRELGAIPISDVNYDVVQSFVSGLPLAPKTVQGCYGVLHLILTHAARTGKLARAVPKPDMPRVTKSELTVPTREQVEALAAASDKRLMAPVLLAGYCGLREGELLALLREDIHLDDAPPWLLVRHARNKTSGATESTKTGRIRRVYLPGNVVTALRAHLVEYDTDLLVPTTASGLQKSWQFSRHRCGLDGVRFHDLRHAAASMMIAAGLNVLQVSKQLGHANPTQTLNTYSHLWPESFDDAMRRLDEYLAG